MLFKGKRHSLHICICQRYGGNGFRFAFCLLPLKIINNLRTGHLSLLEKTFHTRANVKPLPEKSGKY